MSRLTNMFVAPLSSDHRGFRRYGSLLLLLLLSVLGCGAVLLWIHIKRYGASEAYSLIDLTARSATMY